DHDRTGGLRDKVLVRGPGQYSHSGGITGAFASPPRSEVETFSAFSTNGRSAESGAAGPSPFAGPIRASCHIPSDPTRHPPAEAAAHSRSSSVDAASATSVPRSFPVETSQILRVPSHDPAAALPPDASRSTEWSHSAASSRFISLPFSAFQILTVLSLPADAMV